jgi:gentisate 1,2-dioxygenase
MLPSELRAMMERLKEVQVKLPERIVWPTDTVEYLDLSALGNQSRVALVPNPSYTFEIFLQVIPPGGHTDRHRHYNETLHYILSGSGYSEVEGVTAAWKAGDLVYTPPWAWHRHFNSGSETVRILGIENSRLLDRIGGLNRRVSEAAKEPPGEAPDFSR